MKSYFGQMYLDLQKRIKSEVSEIRFVEQNFGQYLDDQFLAGVSYPAVLIDFPTTPFSNISADAQLGIPTINLLLMFKTNSQSYDIAPEAVKEKALGFFEIEEKLHQALQGWSPDYCDPLSRASVKSQNRHDKGVRIRELDYTSEYESQLAPQGKPRRVGLTTEQYEEED